MYDTLQEYVECQTSQASEHWLDLLRIVASSSITVVQSNKPSIINCLFVLFAAALQCGVVLADDYLLFASECKTSVSRRDVCVEL